MPAFRTALATTVTTATTVGLLLAAAPAGAATAAATPVSPAFLSAAQMPPASTPWTAGKVTKGLPEGAAFCAPGALPGARAAEIVTKLRRAFATCATRIEQQYPTTEAISAYHGKLAVEEGAYVYSLDTEDPEVGSTDINLFSVGRDGRTVTYVQWGQLGDLENAPLKGFKTTTRIAVNKLYR